MIWRLTLYQLPGSSMQKMKSAKMIRRPRHKPHDIYILYVYIIYILYIYQRRHGIVMNNITRKMGLFNWSMVYVGIIFQPGTDWLLFPALRDDILRPLATQAPAYTFFIHRWDMGPSNLLVTGFPDVYNCCRKITLHTLWSSAFPTRMAYSRTAPCY
jgi:hypothetical protein